MGFLINPYQQFRDDSGNPVSAGTLTFYVEGDVTTQKNVYTTEDLTTTQSNPYTLDAYGRVQGNVYLDGTYTIVLKTSSGATVRTYSSVDSFSTTGGGGGGGETVQGSIENKFINGACRVPSDTAAPTISGSYQEAEVAGIYVKAQGTPTNGTADLVKTTSVGTSGYAMQVTDLTTGGGGTVDYRFRFNSVDSRDLVSQAAIFQCNVLQNTGTSKTYTISIYKANAEDNFSGTTLIGQSSGTSVSDSTDTKISFSVADMGDCSNGIEVVLSCACGAVTTKDFYIADIVFRKGQAEIVFEQNTYAADYVDIKYGARTGILQKNALIDLGLSLAADTDHDITIATGNARDATNAVDINLTSAITKRIDGNWAAGTGNGGFPSGLTLTASTWYYIYLIAKTDGTVDAGYDTSATAANLLADATEYTYYRSIGAVYTNTSSNINDFYHVNNIGRQLCRVLLTANVTMPAPPHLTKIPLVRLVGAGGGGESSASASGSVGGDTYVDTNYKAEGGGAGGGATPGGGGGSSITGVTFPTAFVVDKVLSGQTGGTSTVNGYGGESGVFAGDQQNDNYIRITGGTTAGNGTYGGGGGGGDATSNGGGGGGCVDLKNYPVSNGLVFVIGAAGAGGAGGTAGGDGGAGYAEVYI